VYDQCSDLCSPCQIIMNLVVRLYYGTAYLQKVSGSLILSIMWTDSPLPGTETATMGIVSLETCSAVQVLDDRDSAVLS
jgi:hypothetical protein